MSLRLLSHVASCADISVLHIACMQAAVSWHSSQALPCLHAVKHWELAYTNAIQHVLLKACRCLTHVSLRVCIVPIQVAFCPLTSGEVSAACSTLSDQGLLQLSSQQGDRRCRVTLKVQEDDVLTAIVDNRLLSNCLSL